MNGHEVDTKKGWSAFDRRDISDQLIVGKNSVEVKVMSPEVPGFGPDAGAKTTKGALAALIT